MNRGSWPADNLDSLNVVDRHSSPDVVSVPDKDIRDRDVVDEHENLWIILRVNTSNRVNRTIASRDNRHVQSRHRLEHLVKIGGPNRLDLVSRNDSGNSGRFRD